MNSIHKRIVQFYPESVPSDEYENILLRTIRVPKNLMYVTEHLPGSTYDVTDFPKADSLRAFADAAKKRNTTNDIPKGFSKAKRHQSVERGGAPNEYLSLNTSDPQY